MTTAAIINHERPQLGGSASSIPYSLGSNAPVLAPSH